MSTIRLENLKDIKEHIEQFGTTPLYWRNGDEFVIIAARLSWKGKVAGEVASKDKTLISYADELEEWLLAHGARKIKEYYSFEELFSK